MGALGRPKRSVEDAMARAVERGLVSELRTARCRAGDKMEAPLYRIAPEALPTIKRPTLGDWLG
jgi:hypothetical protein